MTSENDELIVSIGNMRIELGKLIGLLENLRYEVKKDKLDRNECKLLVSEFRAALTNLKQCLIEVLRSFERQESDSHKADVFSFLKAVGEMFQSRKFEDSLDPLLSKIDLVYQLDNPSSYSDKDIQNRMLEFARDLEVVIATLDRRIFKRLQMGVTGLSRIGELVSEKLAGLDENWVAANTYLSAMEIMVNKKLAELGIKKEGLAFDKRFEELLKALETKGGKISEAEKRLTPVFWAIRNKVVHQGYSPNQKELDLVTDWVKSIIRSLDIK